MRVSADKYLSSCCSSSSSRLSLSWSMLFSAASSAASVSGTAAAAAATTAESRLASQSRMTPKRAPRPQSHRGSRQPRVRWLASVRVGASILVSKGG